MEQMDQISAGWATRMATDRQSLQRRDTENFLRDLTLLTYGQRDTRWLRDYRSVDDYVASVAPMPR